MATLHDGRQHLQAWQISGLSQAAYYRQFGLNPKTFSGWRRRYSATPTRPRSELLPIQVAPPVAGQTQAVALRLTSGHQLELPASTAPAWLAELIRCLA
jgi:hypothetical protein